MIRLPACWQLRSERACPDDQARSDATILPARNADWGFFGTIRQHADPDAAWTIASQAVARATRASPEGMRDFLDSRHGRHFADDVANGLVSGKALQHAIDAAVTRWMGWTIDRRTAREHGIPHGLPFLTGLATHYQILAEADGWTATRRVTPADRRARPRRRARIPRAPTRRRQR